MSEQGPSTRSNLSRPRTRKVRGAPRRDKTLSSLPRPVQLDALERPLGGDRGGPRAVEQERDLAKVVGGAEAADFHGGLALVAELSDDGGALDDDEEVVAGLALRHHHLVVVERDGLEGVGHRQALPLVEALYKMID